MVHIVSYIAFISVADFVLMDELINKCCSIKSDSVLLNYYFYPFEPIEFILKS
jgi:hypothetical protein